MSRLVASQGTLRLAPAKPRSFANRSCCGFADDECHHVSCRPKPVSKEFSMLKFRSGVFSKALIAMALPALLAASPITAASQSVRAAEQGSAEASSLPTIPYEKYQLKNGLDVILSEDHRLPMVAVNLWYHVGPA